jgi:hypothetical protein
MDEQEALAANRQRAPVRLLGEPESQLRVDAGAGAGARAVRAEKVFLMVADNHLRAAPPQKRDDIVRETVFVNTVTQTDQLVDIAHYRKSPGQSPRIAVNVGDDADFHLAITDIEAAPVCLRSPAAITA